MRAFLSCTIGLAVVWEATDFNAMVNVMAVVILSLIAWFVKTGVARVETRLNSHSGRLRVVELNIERLCANRGIRPKRFVETDDDLLDEDEE